MLCGFARCEVTVSEQDLAAETGTPSNRAYPNLDVRQHTGAATEVPSSHPWRRLILPVAMVAALAFGPNLLNDYWSFLANLAIIYALMTLSYDMLLGWSGQMGLAQAALVGLGAYGVTVMMNHGIPYLLSLPLAGILAAVVSVIIGLPAIRLRGFFLAIATLAFGLVIAQLFSGAQSITGGGGGIAVGAWAFPGYTAGASIYWLSLAITAAAFLGVWRLVRGRFGRTLLAIKTAPPAAEALGVPIVRYRLYAFALSGALAAIAGGLFAQLQTYIYPQMFNTNFLVLMLIMLILGGSVSMWGPVFGSAFAVGIVQLQQSLGSYQNLAYGLTLMAAIGVLPGGIVSLWAMAKRYVRRARAGRNTVDSSRVGDAEPAGSL